MQRIRRRLILLHRDRLFREQVRAAAGKHFEVRAVEGWGELEEEFPAAPASTVMLVDPYDGVTGGREVAPQLGQLLHLFPSATIVAAMEMGRGRLEDVRRMGELGVVQVISLEEEQTPLAISRRLDAARGRPLRVLLRQKLPPATSGPARAILDAAAGVVAGGGQATDLARSLHITTRTLLRWSRRAGLPAPKRLLVWMRVLLAAEMLDDPGRTVSNVALACGYASDASLRLAMRSLLGISPGALREEGAFETASAGFLRALMEAKVEGKRYRRPSTRTPERSRLAS